MQAPLLHSRMPVHAALPPHEHWPVAEHPSPLSPSVQSVHARPLLPHVVTDRVRHTLPSQQPDGHDDALHTHAPPTHCCPIAHAGPEPQRHSPPEHVLARSSHAKHASPAVPHAAIEGGAHVAPLQQPLGQVAAEHPEHTPELHVDDEGHSAHVEPPTPHASLVVPALHVVPSQQPAHDAPSQTHSPSSQRWPAGHGALEPQRHCPLALHRSVLTGLHATHAPPLGPHAPNEGVVQVEPKQQPAHVVESQTHPPALQRWPAAHAGPVPQRHSPSVHESASVESHVPQAAPPVPHIVLELVRHTLPSQQPLGHDVASHTHMPSMHRWPLAHGAPDPHAHEPAVQRSARSGSQAMHAPPDVPQVARLGALHVEPEQHPVGQLAAQPSHTPAVQPPPPQLWHAPPPTPHCAGEVPASHVPSVRQHPGQLAPSHSHMPSTQCCPAAHSAPPPQLHAPAAVHRSERSGSQVMHAPPGAPQLTTLLGRHTSPSQQPDGQESASQTQPALVQRWPSTHAVSSPQRHAPPAPQESALIGSHATHVAPPIPQVSLVRTRHSTPSQQPEGHDIASQMQSPATQRWPPGHVGPSPHAQPPAASQ